MSHLAFSQNNPNLPPFGPGLNQGITNSPSLDLNNESNRQQLTKMVMRLFEHWKLSTADQLELLGLSANSRRMLTQYRQGRALPNNRDMQDRIGWLLVIHQNLRNLFPSNPELCYTWVHRRNPHLDNWSPLEVMKEQGFLGIFRTAQLTEHLVDL
jgi:hypothetical protein